jgi:GNAT superfamily N-acetyltransferase
MRGMDDGVVPVSAGLIRQSSENDRPALTEMLLRCTPLTLRRRFHGIAHCFPEPYLTHCLTGRLGHFGLVVELSGTITAFASCVTAAHSTAELSILIEDFHQGHGIGSQLLNRLIAEATQHRFRTLTASVLAEQTWVLRMFRPYDLRDTGGSCGVLDVTFQLPSPPSSAGACL